MRKTDFPIKAPALTYNFGDLVRYFKYNMGSGMIMATLERMVADAREDMEGNKFGAAMKFIGVGIMLFMLFLGAYILISSPSLGGGGRASSVSIPTIGGFSASIMSKMRKKASGNE